MTNQLENAKLPRSISVNTSDGLDVDGTIADSLNKNVRSPKHASTSGNLEITEQSFNFRWPTIRV